MPIVLSTNEWILINDIIYRINSEKEIKKVQKIFLELVTILIPNNASCFFLADNTNQSLLMQGVGIGLNENDLNRYLDNGQDLDYIKEIMVSGRSMVYRETDYFSEEEREATAYYQKYYAPKDFHYCIQVTFSHRNKFLGVVSLYRSKKENDFDQKDFFILDILKEHISLRLFVGDMNIAEAAPSVPMAQNLQSFAAKTGLTKREFEVLSYIMDNYTNEEIAEKMVISIHTLKKHILNLYKKCNVTSRVQLYKQLEHK